VEADETAGMAHRRIVMRPVHDRRFPTIVYHLAAHLDAIPDGHRTAWRDIDVIDDLDRARRRYRAERLVQTVRWRSVEVAGG